MVTMKRREFFKFAGATISGMVVGSVMKSRPVVVTVKPLESDEITQIRLEEILPVDEDPYTFRRVVVWTTRDPREVPDIGHQFLIERTWDGDKPEEFYCRVTNVDKVTIRRGEFLIGKGNTWDRH